MTNLCGIGWGIISQPELDGSLGLFLEVKLELRNRVLLQDDFNQSIKVLHEFFVARSVNDKHVQL